MIPIAPFLLQTASIKRYQSTTPRGDNIYGAPQTLAVRYQPNNRLVRQADGSQAVASATLYTVDSTVTVRDLVLGPGASRYMTPLTVRHHYDLLTGAYSYSAVTV